MAYARLGSLLITAHDGKQDTCGAIATVFAQERFRAAVNRSRGAGPPGVVRHVREARRLEGSSRTFLLHDDRAARRYAAAFIERGERVELWRDGQPLALIVGTRVTCDPEPGHSTIRSSSARTTCAARVRPGAVGRASRRSQKELRVAWRNSAAFSAFPSGGSTFQKIAGLDPTLNCSPF